MFGQRKGIMARAEVAYSGYVQGVGFRFTARSIAAGYAVTGYVKNLSDGRVEVVAEGERAEVEAFLGELASVMGQHIDKAEASWTEGTGEFRGFTVRF
jgi:acylphosphatase